LPPTLWEGPPEVIGFSPRLKSVLLPSPPFLENPFRRLLDLLLSFPRTSLGLWTVYPSFFLREHQSQKSAFKTSELSNSFFPTPPVPLVSIPPLSHVPLCKLALGRGTPEAIEVAVPVSPRSRTLFFLALFMALLPIGPITSQALRPVACVLLHRHGLRSFLLGHSPSPGFPFSNTAIGHSSCSLT